MHCIKVDRPTDWEEAHIYPLADWHLGDEHADEALIHRILQAVKDDPYALCLLNGDLMNTATKQSVSDIYSEQLSPMKQIDALCTMLNPIRDKIIGVTTGNHEARVYRTDGIDMMRLVCRELCVEKMYSPEGVLVFLRFGTAKKSGRHMDSNPKQCYSIYMTHGVGGGRKEGSKILRLVDMAAIIDADIYVMSHDHLPLQTKEAFYRVNYANSTASVVEKSFVNTGAKLNYGGYSQTMLFKPSSKATPRIIAYAKTKEVELRM